MNSIAIIGGGAAGLAASVAAAETLRDAGALPYSVRIFEANDRVGKTILATGNGRCNITNTYIEKGAYCNAPFVEAVLNATDEAARPRGYLASSLGEPRAILNFFASCGLVIREEGEGRKYPLANKASSVRDCLRARAHALGVEECCEAEVVALEPPRAPGAPFTLRLKDGRFERAQVVIMACGGKAARGEVLPRALVQHEQRPVLGPLATASPWPRRLDNIRVRGALELLRPREAGDGVKADTFIPQQKLQEKFSFPAQGNTFECVNREVGEVMFRKYGMSGIAAFNMSRLASAGDVLALDFLPLLPPEETIPFLRTRARHFAGVLGVSPSWADILRGIVLDPVADVLCAACEVKPEDTFVKKDAARLASVLRRFIFPVSGIGDAAQCQVMRGGVAVDQIDATTCETLAFPGLYVVGEALDVDAACGGYNLHWAWSTGLLAGWSAAESLMVRGVA
jgi:hypothetical protein